MSGSVTRPAMVRMKKGKNCPLNALAIEFYGVRLGTDLLIIIIVGRHAAAIAILKRKTGPGSMTLEESLASMCAQRRMDIQRSVRSRSYQKCEKCWKPPNLI